MKLRSFNIHHGSFFICHFYPFLIRSFIKLTGNRKPCLCCGILDEPDNGLSAGQWFPSPIFRESRKHSMVDVVPCAGSWRIVTDMETQAKLICSCLYVDFPQSDSGAMTSTSICCDEHRRSRALGCLPLLIPPCSKRIYRKFSRIITALNGHESLMALDIVNTALSKVLSTTS